jgi:hypothetical protein
LKTLAYFDYFDHPLTAIEIFSFMPCRCEPGILKNELHSLVDERLIFKVGRFYALRNEPFMVSKRMQGHRSAIEDLIIAKKIGRFLSRLPFVEAVAVSGSLSKYYADENTDIDFFIITSVNRLWIARTIMHFFKKISFIIGKQDWFCMNYYIDESKMEIPEKNLFTAIEIATLMPLEGELSFRKFLISNSWVHDFLPCYTFSGKAHQLAKGFLRKVVEGILGLKVFDSIEALLMRITSKRWQKKAQKSGQRNDLQVMGMAADKHFSKPDPAIFQQKFLQAYDKRIKQYTEAGVPTDKQ